MPSAATLQFQILAVRQVFRLASPIFPGLPCSCNSGGFSGLPSLSYFCCEGPQRILHGLLEAIICAGTVAWLVVALRKEAGLGVDGCDDRVLVTPIVEQVAGKVWGFVVDRSGRRLRGLRGS